MRLQAKIHKISSYSTHKQLIYFIVGILFLEFCTMLVMDILPPFPLLLKALIDCIILTILLAPAVYFFVIRPEGKYQIERKRAKEALKEIETHFYTLANSGQALIWTSGVDKKCNYLNQPWLNFTGRTLENELGDGWFEGVHPDDLQQYIETYQRSFDSREKFSTEFRLRKSSGEYSWIQNDGTPRYNSNGDFIGYIGHCLDINGRKQVERYREMAREILQILNEPKNNIELIQRVISSLKAGTGFNAVGIRLQEGDDFPYISQKGFSNNFLLSENLLIDRAKDGEKFPNNNCDNLLACNCGLVISGNIDPTNPHFTPGGSWWTNDISLLQNDNSYKDDRFHLRNVCMNQGYASVALIPIRNMEKIVGLIQLNDHRNDLFTINIIESLEGIASHLGAMLMRTEAEEALRLSEERLRTITENAPNSIMEVDKYGRIIYTNHILPANKLEDAIGKKFWEWTPQEYHDESIKALEYVFGNALPKSFQSSSLGTNGEIYRYQSSLSPVIVSGKVENAILIISDITERIKSQERYSAILQAAMDGFWLVDLKGYLLEVNKTYCMMSGYSKQELLTMHISDLDVIDTDSDIDARMQKIKSQGEDSFESKHRCKDGSIFDVEVNIQYVPIDGGQFVVFLHDITKRKLAQNALMESEWKFRKYIDHAPHGIFVANEKGQYIDTNIAAGKITGYSTEELLSINLVDLIHEDSREKSKQHFNRVISEGFANGDFAFVRKDGSKGYWSVDAVKLSDKILLGFVVDITKRKQTEELLANNERLLRESQAAAHIGSYSADLINKIWTASPEMYKIFGIDENHPRTMEAWMMSVHPDFREELVNEVFQVEAKRDRLDREYKIVRISDNVERWVHGIGEYEFDNQMNPIRLIGTIQDITNRKKVEEALRASEESLKKAQKIAHVGSWSLDLDKNLLTWNDEMYRIFDVPPQEFPATYEGFLDSVHPEDRDAVNAAYTNSIMEGKDSYKVEHRLFRKHSLELRHVLEKCEHVRDTSGKIIRSIGMTHDITELKQAELALIQLNEELEKRIEDRTAELLNLNETLKLAEEKYRTVADFTTNWEFWISPDDQMIYCSPSCERITGYSVTDFVVNPQLLFDIIHPEDLPKYLEHKKQEILSHTCEHEIKFRIFRKDGSIRWIGHFCQPVFDESGHFKGIRGSNSDINARKKAEELLKKSNLKYSLLSANITDGIFIIRDDRFEYINRAMSHIFGYQRTELIGLGLNHLILPEYANELEFMQTVPPLNQIRNVEIECVKKDRSTIYVEFLFNYIGTEKVIYGVAHDITDKKQIQRNIVKAIILTEEKERALFSKELHDGLGPLLSTIKLYLQWSERSKSNKSREEIILKTENILEDALTAVKEISNKLSPHLLINYGLCSAIRNFIDKLEETSSIRILFDCKITKRLGDEIEAAVYRAIIECINNTIKHSGAKIVTINLQDNDNYLEIQYRDDGVGFDLDEALAVKKGLGLFNLQNRIQNIGGKITMFSKSGQGVYYKITINI